jgi:galactose mutarotase-like enzyme
MQVHGFARNVDWQVTKTADGDAPMVEMTLLPSDYTKAMWPADFKATQTITLKDGALTATMAVSHSQRRRASVCVCVYVRGTLCIAAAVQWVQADCSW